MAMRRVYCISGLGADHRIFDQLQLSETEMVPVPWLMPLRGEPIAAYAKRMKENAIEEEQPVLLGVSFGGMMAIELAKLLPAAKVVIVSSVRERRQLPFWMKFCGMLTLDRLIPLKMRRGVSAIERHWMGLETEKDEALFQAFKASSDPMYMRWAIAAILRWQNHWTPASFYHIHGGRDRVFPLHKVQVTHIIPDGGHFMIFNRAAEINRILTGLNL